jgi:hypothetical protein
MGRELKKPADKTGFASGGVTRFVPHGASCANLELCVRQLADLVLADSLVLQNPLLRQTRKR